MTAYGMRISDGSSNVCSSDLYYKLVGVFDKRFPEGAPSLAKASSLRIEGDWTFGHGVQLVGDVKLGTAGAARIAAGGVIGSEERRCRNTSVSRFMSRWAPHH